jgi:hypothetical protein
VLSNSGTPNKLHIGKYLNEASVDEKPKILWRMVHYVVEWSHEGR